MTEIHERGHGGRFGAATPGVRPDRASLADLLDPGPARRRWPAWRQLIVMLAVVVTAAGGYAAGRLLAPSGPPPMVRLVVTGAALPQGTSLSHADLRVVRVPAAAAPAGALGPSAVSAAGLKTSRPMPAGAFLTRSELVPGGAVPGPDQALVGLALKPGELPAGGLVDGQRVLVVLLPQTAQGAPGAPVDLTTTTVWSVGGLGGSGTVEATVLVPRFMATSLAGHAARGEVALVAVR